MPKKGENKFGLKVEDFPSYEDYRKEYIRLLNKFNYQANPEKESARVRAWQEANPDKVKAYSKAWAEANPDKVKAHTKKWQEANPEKVKAYVKAWREANPEKESARVKAWREANPEKESARVKAWREANPEKESARVKAWREANPERYKANLKAWADSNRGLRNATQAKRKTALLERIPSWADLEAIKKFYEDCPQGYAVDHIIPLQGKLVSGLHVLENLQYLTKSENSAKHNKFDIEDQEKYF